MGLLAFALPLLAVLIGGPILLARRKQSGNVWFVAQILAVFGLLAALIVIQRGAFGPIGTASVFLLLILGPVIGLALAALIFRKPQS